MSTAQTVYVVSTKDSLGFDIERVFSEPEIARLYGENQHNITEWIDVLPNVWMGKANGVEVWIHGKSVHRGAKWA